MLPLSQSQTAKLYKEALRRLAAGDLDGAEARLHKVLAARPDQAEALFQMGRISLTRGAIDEALDRFAAAAKARPHETAIWKAYAQAVVRHGDEKTTRRFLKAARGAGLAAPVLAGLESAVGKAQAPHRPNLGTLRPEDANALISLVNSGKLAEADTRAQKLRRAHPGVPFLAEIHARILARRGKPDGARAAFEEALRLDPDFLDARINYGRFLVETGAAAAGAGHLQAALSRVPKSVPALLGLGQALTKLGDAEGAVNVLSRAADLAPKSAEPQFGLGHAHMAAKAFDAAAAAFAKAIALGDRRAATYAAEAQALTGAGRVEEALAAHDKAVAIAPDRPESHGRRAILLQHMGRFDDAETGLRHAIGLSPENGEAYRLLVKGRKIAADDPLIPEMEALFARDDMSDHSRMNLAFALAKAMEDCGAHDRIFGYLHEANALMRKLYPYDIAEREAEVVRVKAAFADTDFSARRIEGATDYAPVFVTGMPRSGTTLVEQIIASHSRVTGGGELGFVAPTALRLLSDGSGGLRALSDLADDEIAEFGRKVEAHFRMRLPGSDIVTDKSIQTYMVAGLVRLALPNARIVIVHRDPRDTGLSIYKNIFSGGTHRYAYNLRDLGLYYRTFLDMIAFWRERLPDGLHEIRYEDLIADPEPEARALIAACGLDWEDGCLDFHKTERRVSTLSMHQVRQPLYSSSMKAWERHAEDLEPLIEALGDAID